MNSEFKNIIELVKDQEKKILFIDLFKKGNNLQKAKLLERIEKFITIKN
jgi:hypothetical protein